MDLVTFWGTFSQTHLVTLISTFYRRRLHAGKNERKMECVKLQVARLTSRFFSNCHERRPSPIMSSSELLFFNWLDFAAGKNWTNMYVTLKTLAGRHHLEPILQSWVTAPELYKFTTFWQKYFISLWKNDLANYNADIVCNCKCRSRLIGSRVTRLGEFSPFVD
jgi:hypothetical protein